MAALIGALRVSLSADTAKFEAGMKRAQATAHRTSSGINKSLGLMKAGLAGLAAGLSVGMLTRVVGAALEYAGSLAEISQQLGVTTRDLQVFRFAAGQVGVKQEELEKGLGKLTITLGQVAAGAKAPAAALKAIGLNAQEVARMNTGDAFRAISDGLAQVTDRSQRAAIEVALFGRAGAKLDNLLAGGSGALNELANAAERLGIVLSDEQIAKADQTADKLDAMKTVLSARIAGVVADNADAILQLADALGKVVGFAAQAAGGFASFASSISNSAPLIISTIEKIMLPLGLFLRGMQALQGATGGHVRGLNKAGKSVTVALPPLKGPGVAGRNIGQFLAPSGGGGRKRGGGGSDDAERKRLEALRKAFQLEEEMRRAQIDILRAQKELSIGYVARNTISVQILDLERAAYKAQLDFEVASKEKTQAQADSLLALYDQKDSLERQAIIADEQAQAAQDSAHLDQVSLDLDRDRLESEAQLAETAKEERRIRLKILEHLYAQERARLEAIIADKQSSDLAKEEARRRLQGLDETEANDRQGVLNDTRGPMGDFLNTLPTTADKWNEALESVAVNGLQSLEDGLISILDGTKSVGEAFSDMAKSIIADLVRIAIQKYITAAIGNALFPGAAGFSSGGYTGYATGGFTGMGNLRRIAGIVHKREYVLNAKATQRLGVPALNALNRGAPLAAVSNDNSVAGVRGDVHIHMSGAMSDRQARQTGMQAAAGYKSEMARASRKGMA
jgi:hypothetical protein